MKMERPKLRPTVTITTYSASSSSFGKQQQHKRQQQQSASQEEATKSEFSTDFFHTFRCQARGQAAANRVLVDLSQIKGPTGSIRGHKDVVRKSLEGIKVAYNRRVNLFNGQNQANTFAFQWAQKSPLRSLQDYSIAPSNSMATNNEKGSKNMEEIYCGQYLERLQEDELDQCVAYTTSLGVIRRTFEDSKVMKSILNLNLINYQERDIFLNQEYKLQLRMRLGSIVVPAFFVDGKHIGGLKELELMNENGELLKTLAKFKMSAATKEVCLCCGNAKFIACQSCNGSRKSTIHHFKFNSIALRCIKCDKNEGLVQCPMCSAPNTTTTANELSEKRNQEVDQNNNLPGELTIENESICCNQISDC